MNEIYLPPEKKASLKVVASDVVLGPPQREKHQALLTQAAFEFTDADIEDVEAAFAIGLGKKPLSSVVVFIA